MQSMLKRKVIVRQKRKLEENSEPGPSGKVQKLMHEYTKCHQAQASKLISEMVVSCSLPLSIVEKDSFKKMIFQISGGNCHSITRKTLSKSIDTQFEKFQYELKEEVKKVDYCCTTADVWSNTKRSFMGMTLHTIDPNTLKRKSYPIACERFYGRHTFDKVAEIIVNIHNQYDLSTSKVTKVITDNGSNLVKAFKLFGVKSLTVMDGGQCEEIFEDSDNEDEEGDDIELISIPEEDTNGTFVTWNQDIIYELPSREKCFAHTMSLICTTDIKKVNTFPFQYRRIAGPTGTAMGKVVALWNKTNRPRSSEIIVEGFGRSIERPCPTRWNSEYDCLVSLLSFSFDQINKVLDDLQLLKLSKDEFDFLSEYKKCLAPIANAIDKCQSECDCFYGYAIPILQKVRKEMILIQNQELKCCQSIVACILSSLTKRFGPFYDQDQSVMDALIATVSHPKFKFSKILESRKSDVKQQLEKVSEEMLDLSQSKPHDEAFIKDDYFDDSDEEDQNSATKNTKDVASLEVLQYMNDPDTSLQMLHRYPVIKRIFLKYNSALISSAPVERLFSFGSIILQGRRGRLTDKNFEKLLLLKAFSSMNK